MLHLRYGCTVLSTCSSRAVGFVCTCIVHIIPELAAEGCAATLYMQGWSHSWFNARTLMLFSDEEWERDLRVTRRNTHVNSTQQDASISEALKHQLYQKFLHKNQKFPSAKIWAPVHRNAVLEGCMVAANVLWRTIFARLLHHLFELQEASGCTMLMDTEPCSVKCSFVGVKEDVDVFRVCGTCSTKFGMQSWMSVE